MKKILLTGGHITPALALADELSVAYGCDIVFVGRQKIRNTDAADSFEYKETVAKKYRFINLETGKFSRVSAVSTIISLFKMPKGILDAKSILQHEKPDSVVSFGGYIGVPVVIAARFLKIPIFIHEQTLVPGLTTKFAAHFAKKVFVAFPETLEYFDQSKTIVSGNPLRRELFDHANIGNAQKTGQRSSILITGGSQGAHAINVHIEEILPSLLKKYIVYHQCGSASEFKDFDRLSGIHNKNYFVKQHYNSREMAELLQKADLVISRSGANTVWELMALKKPSILIPLPHSAGGEQQAHARYMSDKGFAEIFDQKNISSALLSLIAEMTANIDKYKKRFNSLDISTFSKSASIMAQQIISPRA